MTYVKPRPWLQVNRIFIFLMGICTPSRYATNQLLAGTAIA